MAITELSHAARCVPQSLAGWYRTRARIAGWLVSHRMLVSLAGWQCWLAGSLVWLSRYFRWSACSARLREALLTS